MSLTISNAGIALIKKFEGCRLTAYKDSVGIWTIGYGMTNAVSSIIGYTVKSGKTITQRQAENDLSKVINAKYAPLVNKYNSKYNWTQNEFDALVSFAYNIGSIDALTAKGTRSKSIIANKILEYNKAGRKELAGLTTRRKAERVLFLSSSSSSSSNSNTTNDKSTIKTVQKWLTNYDSISVDGIIGNNTKKAAKKALQTELNILGAELKIDGVIGTKTLDAISKYGLIKLNIKGNLVKILEAFLYINNYNPQEFSGKYNNDVVTAVKEFQSNNSLSTDGICGKNTWSKLIGE